jgi:site-specific recombinase XerD
MSNKNYFEVRNINTIKRLEQIEKDLPYFCYEFFLGIENTTTALTRLNYAYDLRIFFDFIIKKIYKKKQIKDLTLADIDKLDMTSIEIFLSYLSTYTFNDKTENCNEHAKARKLATIRSFYKYFFNKGKFSANTAAKIPTPKLHDKEIIRLEANEKINEIINLLNVVEYGEGLSIRQKKLRTSITKARDIALFTLFLGTGIRVSEMVGLNESDIDFKSNSFKITRKGGNQTILYFSDEIAIALKEYMVLKNNNLKNDDTEEALFLSSINNKRLSTRAIQELVKKYARIVTPLKKITPHKLRSTFGTQLYRATGDIYYVADVLGHKDVNTTKKHYAAISDDLRRSLAGKVKLRDDN